MFKNFVKSLITTSAELEKSDKILLATVGILLVFGLIMLSSASAIIAYNKYQDSYYFFKHQLFGLILGLIFFWFFSKLDYHIWRKYALGMLIASIVLLLLVFIPGLSARWGSARSWINVFGFSLQPSEFVKLSFLLYLAAWLESRRNNLHVFSQGLGPFLVVLGIIAVLMIMQPDIGTLSIISITSLVVYFVGGGHKKQILAVILLGALAMSIMIHFKPYQANRFKCLADPSFSTNQYCYQINQSLIAIGSGGFFGKGLGASRQKFMYIPEVQGDSIFAIIGEETGFLFCLILLVLYLLLFYRGYIIAKNAFDDFGKILAIGIVCWLTLQALINIGGMVNILPMTGVPLPFVSYGGTAIMAVLMALGILVNIGKQGRNES